MENKTFRLDNNLEALRGFAAFFVIVNHIVNYPIDPNYHPHILDIFMPPASLCVLVFFMLSGYVIGISNRKSVKESGIAVYIKKRFVRIYPIYFIGMGLALWVSSYNYPLTTIISNFTLTQGLLTKVIWENNPAWSLHYEVVYYLMFIPISYFKINPVPILILSIIASFINYSLYPHINAPIISTYLNGLSYWLLGLIIANSFKPNAEQTRPHLMLSNVFLLLCMRSYHITATIYSTVCTRIFGQVMEFPTSIYWAKTKVGFGDLFFLPYCFVFIAVFSNINFKSRKVWLLGIQFLPLISAVTLIKTFRGNEEIIVTSTIFYLISFVLFFIQSSYLDNLCRRVLNAAKWFGNISYAAYITHFPLLFLLGTVVFYSGTNMSFTVRVLIFGLFVVGMSYVLERKLQLFLKKIFFKK